MVEKKKPLATKDVGGFIVNAKLKGSFSDVEKILASVEKAEVAKTKDGVSLAYVETRDLNGNPLSFFIVEFKKDKIEVYYSIPPEIPPSRRKWEVIKKLLTLLMLLSNVYDINVKDLVAIIDMVIKDLDAYVEADYKKLYASYDKAKMEVKKLRRRVNILTEENERLMEENYQLKTKNDELLARIEKLETVSRETLRERIQDWLREHNGEINIGEFARIYSVPESVVEEELEKLVKEGYLKPV